MNIQTVTVLGANGTMGSNVAAVFASFGNAKVYVMARTMEKAILSIEKAVSSVKCDSIRKNLVPAIYEQMEECINESDLVFESVAENLKLKKEIICQASKYMNENAIFCTGTSGLSINELSSVMPEKQKSRFLGMHMFNPPYTLRLCEIIPTKVTDANLLREVIKYTSTTLLRCVIEVSDTPGFLGNRVGFYFINRAIQFAEKYKEKGGIDYIDTILGKFTGRSMSPIETADFVGLDIHKSIVDYLYENTNDYAHNAFILPEFANSLVQEKRLGKKTGEGFYKFVNLDSGKKVKCVYDVKTGKYREIKHYDFPFIDEMKALISESNYTEAFYRLIKSDMPEARICMDFLINYVMYSLVIGKEVATSDYAADIAMAEGFNWCPPSEFVKLFGGKECFTKLVTNETGNRLLQKMSILDGLDEVSESLYDYRKYIKA